VSDDKANRLGLDIPDSACDIANYKVDTVCTKARLSAVALAAL
jgi:hypothetical protein